LYTLYFKLQYALLGAFEVSKHLIAPIF